MDEKSCGMYIQWSISQSLKRMKPYWFLTTWTDVEGIMLSEISQRKTNTTCFHFYVEPKE